MNFNLKKAAIYQALEWEKILKPALKNSVRKIFFWLPVAFFILFIYGIFVAGFSDKVLTALIGAAVLSFFVFLIFWEINLFFEKKLAKPAIKIGIKDALLNIEEYNLAEFLDIEAARIIYNAVKFSNAKKFSETSSSAIFYSLLFNNQKIDFIFSRLILDIKNIKKILEAHFKIHKTGGEKKNYSQDFEDVIIESLKIAAEKGKARIGVGDILFALAKIDLVFRKILIDAGLKWEDIDSLAEWTEYMEERIERNKKFWEYKNLAKKGSLAKEWAAGYTITLDKFSIDWTEYIRRRGFEEIVGHKAAISQIERILSRIEINNVLLVGEPGTGRGAIIQALAQKCLFGESLKNLNYQRVVELDVTSLLAQIEDFEEVEITLDRIFREITAAGNIILVINEFHNFVGQLVRPGVIDISGVLSPYLKSPDFQLLAITNYGGLHKQIEQNHSLLSLLEKVEVEEISEKETILLLENMVFGMERKYSASGIFRFRSTCKKFITYPAIRDIVSYSAKYMPSAPFPKKATDLLDEIMIYVAQNTKDNFILPKHVAKVISEKTQIPMGDLGKEEKEILLNLENLLHQRIVGQEEAVNEISTAMRRTRADITIRSGPMGAFLFLGPTGVGKTETAKALASICFGSEEKMIRLDMSEFQSIEDIPRIIGRPGEEGLLTTKVRENPFSLILLDEFEKAHPDVLNLFLQVFEEGHLTDGEGRKVSFKNSLIIATSNAGYQLILEALKEGRDVSQIKSQLLDFLFKQGVFRPELINRFDAVVVFKSLTKENLLAISELLLKKLKKNLEGKGIDLLITLPLKEKIVELGYSPVFGAREMRRVIQDKVENALAVALLSGKIYKGSKVEILPENFELKIQ